MTDETLLPCPFCGNETSAIAAWNTRAALRAALGARHD
jgi:hypothetical protein